ncbi:glutathione S-transferase [Solemya velum gill symbiont]|nr:glutathione S-transferase [Solemya velum gill symbiont]
MKHYQVVFEEKRIALFTDTTTDELSIYNSDFKVPILKENEFEVWDSLSILEYVSEQYLSGQGWPADANARAVARSISTEMHSSFFNVRNELPMNCRKEFNGIKLSEGAVSEIERIKELWRRCRSEYGSGGEWLFGKYSIADAMFAPVALRFNGYNIQLDGIEKEYVNSVLAHPAIVEWIEAAKLETEVITEDEIDV